MDFLMKQNKINMIAPLAAGALGMIVGAAGSVAVMAAYDEKIRKMLMERFHMMKDQTNKGIKYLMDKTHALSEQAKKQTMKK